MSDRPTSRSTGPFDLSKTPIHLGLGPGATPGAVTLEDFTFEGPSFEAYIEEHCKDGIGGRLIMVETTPANWPAWECHNAGDELVIVLSGRGEFIHEVDGAEHRIPVSAGHTVINPQGVWHTADIEESIQAIYITPISGTESRKR